MRKLAVLGILVGAGLAQAAGSSRPAGVPGEVLLSGAADVKALCEELRASDAKPGDDVYLIALPSTGFSFAPYDKAHARLVIDGGRGFHAPSGAWELAVGGSDKLEMAVPVSAKEAAGLIKQRGAAELSLWVWFRVATLPGQSFACASVHGGKAPAVRLGIEPVAFVLMRGKEQVAAGETSAFAALREADGPVTAPSVKVGAAVLTNEQGNAPEPVARAARALEPVLLACYQKGLDAEPGLRGAIVLGVKVGKDGKVGEARAEIDGLGAPEVTACALARVKGAKFPAGASLRFSFPVRFGAAE